jgi:hypothetical protein
VVVALGVWLAFFYSPRHLDHVLHAVGYMLLLVAGLGAASVLLGTAVLFLRIRSLGGGEMLRLESGSTSATGLSVPSFALFPVVEIGLVWEEPASVEVTLKRRLSASEELVLPRRRGEATRIVRRFLVSDIFGFFSLGLPRRAEVRVRVYPPRARVTAHATNRLQAGDAFSHPSGPAEGELIEMRRYVHGDPLRHILWKAFARTRKLLVRTPERAITPKPSAAAYLVAGPGDEPAASASRYFVEEGLLGRDFVFLADGSSEPTSDPEEALEQIVASGSAGVVGGLGLDRFLGRLDESRRRNVVLFVPPVAGPWLERVLAGAPRIPGARAITAVDERLDPSARPSRLRRLLFAERDAEAISARALAGVVSTLSVRGYEVQVLHRPTGEILGRAQLEALSGRPASGRRRARGAA